MARSCSPSRRPRCAAPTSWRAGSPACCATPCLAPMALTARLCASARPSRSPPANRPTRSNPCSLACPSRPRLRPSRHAPIFRAPAEGAQDVEHLRTAHDRRRVRRGLPVVLHWQAPARKSRGAPPRSPRRGAVPPVFPQSLGPAGGLKPTGISHLKVRSPERYNANVPRIAAAAASEGLVYAPDKIQRQPNTLDCHRLIRWAEAIGAAPRMKQRLMDLYFTEGADLSDREVLVQAASDCGLDADRVREQLASDLDVEAVTRAADSAKDAGI